MTRRLLTIWAVVTAVSGAACTVSQAPTPTLAGPSGFATNITVTANPDTVVLNGQQSLIIVQARDATGAPLANLRVHLDVLVGGLPSNCGRLSLTDVTTASDGTSAVVFTAPTFPLPMPECSGLGGSLTIRVFAVGTNAMATNPVSASINVLTPSSISQSTVFAVNFTMSPNPGVVNVPVTFSNSGSVSPGHTITSYVWTFSDGATKSGSSVTHDFNPAGTYTVTLTITDDIGQSGSKSALLIII